MSHKRAPEKDVVPRYPHSKEESVRITWLRGKRPVLTFVLAVLNGRDPGAVKDHLRSEIENPRDGKVVTEAILKEAEEELVTTMRNMADLWIDSGKDARREVDTPLERNVEDIPHGRDYSLSALIYDALREVNIGILLHRDGSFRFGTGLVSVQEHKVESFGFCAAVRMMARTLAAFWFTQLLNSPLRLHFSRCDECGRYFDYERAARRTIKNGVFCDRCKGAGSKFRLHASRIRKNERLVELARPLWQKWHETSRTLDRSKWLAREMNKKLRDDKAITAKWVTQNQAAIEGIVS